MKNEKLDMGKVRKGVKCYQKVFEGEPYNEDWSTKDVMKELRKYIENPEAKVLTKTINGEVVAFIAGMPLNEKGFDFLEDYVDPNKSFYLAELGVEESFRRKGIAEGLTEELSNDLPEEYEYIVLRTSENNTSKLFYTKLGFTEIPELRVKTDIPGEDYYNNFFVKLIEKN